MISPSLLLTDVGDGGKVSSVEVLGIWFLDGNLWHEQKF